MTEPTTTGCEHDHVFGTDRHRRSERRTAWVVAITLVTMVVEVVAGNMLGSMALLADGWHMGTHAAALGVVVFAYIYARRNAENPRFSFGTGKVYSLGGFASAVCLAVVAVYILIESVERLFEPIDIHFDEALIVAVVGLVINLVSAWLLGHDHDAGHEHGHDHAHEPIEIDHNLRGAYLHVMTDALTSLLAIAALLAGRQLGWGWMDPMIGVLGAIIIARWSVSLLQETSRVLLDAEVSPEQHAELQERIESAYGDRVVDVHLWRVGPGHLAAMLSVVTEAPRQPADYKRLLADVPQLSHLTVEVRQVGHGEA